VGERAADAVKRLHQVTAIPRNAIPVRERTQIALETASNKATLRETA
jgi:hypothetical protein